MLSNRLMSALLACTGVLLITSACDSLRIQDGRLGGRDGSGFSCSSDDDCLRGYRCNPVDALGVNTCVAANNRTICDAFNRDGDNYLAIGAPDECFGLRGDCDDEDPLTYPGAPEICDGKDNSCNGLVDDGLDSVLCPLQLGVCRGATTECVDGGLVDCGDSGAYGPDYETEGAPCNFPNCDFEQACDGLDNDCDGRVDEGCCRDDIPLEGDGNCPRRGARFEDCNIQCRCVPGQAFACGRETGECSRGIRICDAQRPALELPCMGVEPLAPDEMVDCQTADDCDPGQFCVSEFIGPNERFDDDCETAGDPGCSRRICRTLQTTGESCTSDAQCSGSEVCFDGECRPRNISPVAETCNGMDDDCDGRIDNHFAGNPNRPCGQCPFNSARVQVQNAAGGAEFWCVDMYEASRPDADEDDAGQYELYAASQPGVLPWTNVNGTQAGAACGGQAYRDQFPPAQQVAALPVRELCRGFVHQQACGGVTGGTVTNYPYGNTFVEGTCVDSSIGAVQPTGSFAGCSRLVQPSGLPVHDMSGNVAEWTQFTVGAPNEVRGGSFVTAAANDLRCNAIVPATANADFSSRDDVGFRCCARPITN